jgi:hypothetical protein
MWSKVQRMAWRGPTADFDVRSPTAPFPRLITLSWEETVVGTKSRESGASSVMGLLLVCQVEAIWQEQ